MYAVDDLVRYAVGLSPGSLPEDVKDVAKRAILDTLGVCLVGSRSDSGAILLKELPFLGNAPGQATVFGTAVKTSPTAAALINGTNGHAYDFDDVQREMQGHPSVGIVPAVLALGEALGVSGETVLAGYVAGVEADVVLGKVMNPGHYGRGWHATCTIGTLGATLAAARVAGLSHEQALRALGVAGSLACGIQANFGTMTKPLHAGMTAWNGVFAASLAKLGWTANPGFFENKVGYLAAFGSQMGASALSGLVGKEFATRTLQFKKYPSAAETHPPIEAALKIWRKHKPDLSQIEEVDCLVNGLTDQVCAYLVPKEPLEGKFSVPYCVAYALVHGEVGMKAFMPEGFKDEAVQALVRKTKKSLAFKEVLPAFGPAEVHVRLRDGTVLVGREEADKAGPLEWDDVIVKFRDCAAGVISREAAEKTVSTVRRLESVKDIRELTALLAG